jgi:hypothetical protein
MSTSRFPSALAALALAGVFLLLSGCERAASVPRVSTFVGYVENSDAFIALTHLNGEVMAYVCNGRDLAMWLRGDARDRVVELTSSEGHLRAVLDKRGVTGTFTSAQGGVHAFRAQPAAGSSGFYRAAQTVAGLGYVGGWILLSDGQQRGAVKADGVVIEGAVEPLDPARPVVSVPGGGTLTAQPVEEVLAADIVAANRF